ncbi:hypothetical protein C882_3349 [Caenispirillum salinarum AK4]|uniref:Uncharacterized protein n=1 Tax=Caenispirillum salinarum AK4 TaxID=1238182 RepID=K9H5V2_9PROT|nr:hypothetical protein C882_3349 [Caenispirillum salinarum AK4]
MKRRGESPDPHGRSESQAADDQRRRGQPRGNPHRRHVAADECHREAQLRRCEIESGKADVQADPLRNSPA